MPNRLHKRRSIQTWASTWKSSLFCVHITFFNPAQLPPPQPVKFAPFCTSEVCEATVVWVIGSSHHSDGNRNSAALWEWEGEAGAHFKGCIGTNTTVEEGICQEEPARLPTIGSWGCLMGPLCPLEDRGTTLSPSGEGFCTCWTQNWIQTIARLPLLEEHRFPAGPITT